VDVLLAYAPSNVTFFSKWAQKLADKYGSGLARIGVMPKAGIWLGAALPLAAARAYAGKSDKKSPVAEHLRALALSKEEARELESSAPEPRQAKRRSKTL
jgi:hypothetical protein